MFVLAHLSDVHFPVLPRPQLRHLASKRGLGLVNWLLRRRHEHRIEILDALVQDLAAQAPDHIAVTGDLVNVALPAEFAATREFLERLGSPHDVSFVPGNHDAYVRAALGHSHTQWGGYFAGDGLAAEKAAYPYLRRRGPIALIGISTALPTGPFMATGMIGPEQLERVDHLLAEVARDDAFRVVLLHHPPLPLHGGVGLKRLIDAAAFRDILRRHGADLVLFGHIHVKTVNWLDGPQHPIPAVSVASASSTDRGDAPAHYHLFRIDKDAGRWRCEMVTRGFTSDNSGVVELGRRLLVPTPADQ